MSSRHTRTRIVIDAPPDEVWRVLADLDEYPRWTSALRMRPWSGELRAGRRAWLVLRVLPVPVAVPVVFEEASGRRLCWVGGPPGLFRGRHYFELRELDGKTEVIHGEDFAGLLLPVLWPTLEPILDGLYRTINEALAARVREIRP